MKNPCDFKASEYVRNAYTGAIYEVIAPDKKGKAELKKLSTGMVEDWNACNNRMFLPQSRQLQIFF